MRYIRFYLVFLCTAIAHQCFAVENEIEPIHVIETHLKWLSAASNNLAVTEIYDDGGLLIGTTEAYTDYELLCNVSKYTPMGSSRSTRMLWFFEYCEVNIDGTGYFKTTSRCDYDPFGDSNTNLFVRFATPKAALERLKKIADNITVKIGSGEHEGQLALCFFHNEHFFECKKRSLIPELTGSESESQRQIDNLSYWGEQRYWYDRVSGEPRGSQLCYHPSTQRDKPPFHSERIRFKHLNLSSQERYEVTQTLLGKEETNRFQSYGELLKNYSPIDYRKGNRYSFTFVFIMTINILFLIAIIRSIF